MEREFSTKFSDFKLEDLIGKWVLCETYYRFTSISTNRLLVKIVNVKKSGFKINVPGISYLNDLIFDYPSGYRKGKSSNICRCKLLTGQEAFQLLKESRGDKQLRELRSVVLRGVESANRGQLLLIKKILERKS